MNLRLLLFKDCNRNCRGCCNKGFDLDSLPPLDPYLYGSFQGYDNIILTGGEPMLDPFLIKKMVTAIRTQTGTPIILYTAKYDNPRELLSILKLVDGLTVTLHTPKDVTAFSVFNNLVNQDVDFFKEKSLRLNVFYNVPLKTLKNNLQLWKVKKNIHWIKDCPLPSNEVFKRLNLTFKINDKG